MSKQRQTRTPKNLGVSSVDLLARFWDDPVDYDARPASTEPKRSRPRRVVTLVTLVIVGLLFAAAYRNTVAAAPGQAEAHEKLREDIAQQRLENGESAAEAGKLRDEVNELRDDLIGSQDQVDQLHDTEALAGLRAVTGDGMTVTIADGPGPEDSSRTDLGAVYDKDLQLAVNAAWAYGAEAVSIDDQRLTSTSSIRAAGKAILVDFAAVESPYTIKVIGPDEMMEQFETSAIAETFADYEKRYGITMTVTQDSDMTLPAAPASALNHASPKEGN